MASLSLVLDLRARAIAPDAQACLVAIRDAIEQLGWDRADVVVVTRDGAFIAPPGVPWDPARPVQPVPRYSPARPEDGLLLILSDLAGAGPNGRWHDPDHQTIVVTDRGPWSGPSVADLFPRFLLRDGELPVHVFALAPDATQPVETPFGLGRPLATLGSLADALAALKAEPGKSIG